MDTQSQYQMSPSPNFAGLEVNSSTLVSMSLAVSDVGYSAIRLCGEKKTRFSKTAVSAEWE